MEKEEAKKFIEDALAATGLTVDELAARLDYKSLRRARYGEIPLPESKQKHIADIVRLAAFTHDSGHTSLVVREEPRQSQSQQLFISHRSTDDPRERLRAALVAKGMTPGDLAKKIRYDSAIIENVINGSGRVSEPMAEKIAAALDGDLTVEDLLGGSDSPRTLDRSGFRGTVGARAEVQMPGGGRTRIVPLISWAAAGSMAAAAALDEDYTGEGVASTVPGRAFAVEISGDSMHPEINPGDFAVVKSDVQARPGQVVLVRTIHGDVLCKRYSTRDREQLVILSSVNKSYAPIEIPASEIAWIYPVKQVIRNY